MGKPKAINGIKKIENSYKNVNLFSKDDEYKMFLSNCIENQKIREENLNEIYFLLIRNIDYIRSLFNNIEIEFGKDKKELETQINLLKIKIIGISNSNERESLYKKNILSRYFADYILKIIIKKYSDKFKKVNLSLQNIYELITYDINIKIEDQAKLIKSFKNSLPAKLFFNKNNLEDEEYINNLIDYMNNNKDENLLIFNKPINIGQKTFEKDELNFVVAALLYLKKIGNTDAHQNIDNDRDIELNDIKKK